MSLYLVLVQTASTMDGITGDKIPARQAITIASSPDNALAMLNTYSPVKCELVHAIRSENRSDYLERALHHKFRHRRTHSFWFILNNQEIDFIKSLNEQNFVAVFAPPPPQIEDVRAQIEQQLAKAKALQ